MTVGLDNTALLNLPLPVEGYFDGTWGNLVNYALTDYLDIAIAGTLTLTGDGAVTLANTAGTDSVTNISSTTAQYAVVKIAGTLTTTKIVTAPSLSKIYVVDNAATGGTVTFKASGQTGVSVAVGERCVVYYNGTDYVKVVSSVADGVTSVGGTGTVNGITLTGTVTSTGNLTLGGALTGVNLASQVTGTLPVANGGTGVTTSTGTGNVVLSTSPTLVTPVLGTPTSGNFSTGTFTWPTFNQNTSGTAAGLSATLAVASGGTGVTTSTGTGSVVLNTSPSLVTPVLGTPASGNFSSGTFTWPTFNQNTSGTAAGLSSTLAVASGGTGQTSYTNGQLLIGNTTGNTLTKATLTAGSGVTITNSAGGITIAATGTGGTITSVTATSPLASTGGTSPDISISSSTGTGAIALANSPAFTGTPTVPTAPNGTNTTQAASTAYVINQIGAISSGVTTFSGGTTGLTPSLATSGAITMAGTLATANGGTGTTTATGTGSNVLATSPTLVTPILGTPQSGNFSTGTFTWPTFNQNTSGTAAGLSATLPIASGGTGQTTGTAAITALTGTQTSGFYLRSNGSNAVLSAVQASDIPTLNQNTTGTAAGLSVTLDAASGGTGLTTPGANGNVLTSNGTGWVSSAPSGGGAAAGGGIYVNNDVISVNYTIASGQNGFSVGPMTISDGYAITVSSGQSWVII